MKVVRLIAFLVVLVVLVVGVLIFTSANETKITVNYLLGSFTGQLSFILGVTFFVGFFLGLLCCLGFHFINLSKVHFARRKAARLEARVKELETAAKVKTIE